VPAFGSAPPPVAHGLSRTRRGEVQESEVDRLLDLVCMVTEEEHRCAMGLVHAHAGGGRQRRRAIRNRRCRINHESNGDITIGRGVTGKRPEFEDLRPHPIRRGANSPLANS